MGNRSDGANLTPVQSRRGRVLPAAPQGTAALRALPSIVNVLFQLRCPFSSLAIGCTKDVMLVMGYELR